MNNEKATWLIIIIATSALFGAIFGGGTTYLLDERSELVQEAIGDLGIDLGSQIKDQEVERAIVKLLEEETATIKVVEQVVPAVVSVIAKREYSEELVEVGGGTGFFVSANGLVLTNKHVVNGSDGVVYSVLTNEGDEYAVEIVAKDNVLDIAVLQVVVDEGEELPEFPVVELGDSDLIKNGQTVIAIGNALSEYRNSVTKGVVSGTGRRVVAGSFYSTEVIEGAIQTDAAINLGNSGGPLINLFGQVIGVNTAVSSAGEGLGFAIPANSAKKIVNDIVEYGRIIRPWLGVRYIMIDEAIAEENGLDADHGALVLSGQGITDYAVIPDSPADEAGIKEGDIIIMIDETEIDEENSLSEQINIYEPGDLVDVTVVRQGEELTVETTLTELDASVLE